MYYGRKEVNELTKKELEDDVEESLPKAIDNAGRLAQVRRVQRRSPLVSTSWEEFVLQERWLLGFVVIVLELRYTCHDLERYKGLWPSLTNVFIYIMSTYSSINWNLYASNCVFTSVCVCLYVYVCVCVYTFVYVYVYSFLCLMDVCMHLDVYVILVFFSTSKSVYMPIYMPRTLLCPKNYWWKTLNFFFHQMAGVTWVSVIGLMAMTAGIINMIISLTTNYWWQMDEPRGTGTHHSGLFRECYSSSKPSHPTVCGDINLGTLDEIDLASK